MERRTFRFVEFKIVQDPLADPVFTVTCVSGDEKDCGESSGALYSVDAMTEWMRKHAQDNRGHWRYAQTCTDYAVMEPPGKLKAQLVAEPLERPCDA
ncbi:DUF7848 domain-containing protein [Streptomyces sp. NPDC001658]